MMTNEERHSAVYRQEVGEVLAALNSDGRRGLTEEEARARLQRYGRNELTPEKPVPAWKKSLAQFQDALVILLIVATAISLGLWFYERQTALPYEAMAIFAVVVLNAAMGYIQESRAESAVAALKQMAAAQARVVRDGERRSLPAAEVVPGDIILVEEWDTVPADARVIHSTSLKTAEAALTGESLPVAKDSAPVSGEVALGDRDNTAARRQCTGADARWWSQRGCTPRWAASRGCFAQPRTKPRLCRKNSTESASCWD